MNNKLIGLRLTWIAILFTCVTFGQEKPIVFYYESGEQVSKQTFIEDKNLSKYLDLYFENDTTQVGLLVTRQKNGQLDKNAFEHLKRYLTKLTDKQIDSTQNIVINYLTACSEMDESNSSRSKWNVLHKSYLKELHKIANINQFWINSLECSNLDYYYDSKINWVADKDKLLKKLFFPYEVRHGNYILIKPDGKFYYRLGEHSKYHIWENAKFFLNKPLKE